ncbi:MAG TPA: helix-turn-helix transcriptional regulator, partial [Acidimicrobiales bacterium]|nr:helix-turn-helix transcriptional regulator [Acidimicrobiales bacterium]
MSDPASTLGDTIARLRRARGLSQAALAEALGVTRTNVSNWENDRTRPNREHLDALRTLFGQDGEEIVAGVDDDVDAPVFDRPVSVLTLQRRTVTALIQLLSEHEAVDGRAGYGWPHDMDAPNQRLSALSTAYGLRAVLQAGGPDRRVSLPRLRAVLRRLEMSGGGWTPAGCRLARPEVTAVVVSALRDAGEAEEYVSDRTALLVAMLERSVEGDEPPSPYVLALSLLEMSGLGADDAVCRRLLDHLVDLSSVSDGARAWPVTARSRRGLGGPAPPPSTPHTAIAVCTLAAWARRLDDDGLREVGRSGRAWLERHADLSLDDEWLWDGLDRVAVCHFTP